MITLPRDRYQELCAFYGTPDANSDGTMDPRWEEENIVRIVTPYQMFTSWSDRPIKTIRCHRKIAPYLQKALEGISKEFSSKDIANFQLNKFGGCLTEPRLKKSGHGMSVHCFGAAIDLAPVPNKYGKEYNISTNMIPMRVVEIFKDHGAIWGGKWRTPDAMHFQWTQPF